MPSPDKIDDRRGLRTKLFIEKPLLPPPKKKEYEHCCILTSRNVGMPFDSSRKCRTNKTKRKYILERWKL